MAKYKSCRWIEHGMVFDYQNLIRTCNNINATSGGRPILISGFYGEKIDKDALFSLKNSIREKFKSGDIVDECKNCVLLEEKDWDEENYINYILLTPWYKCNSKCSYCNAPNDREIISTTKEYDVYKVLKQMIADGIIRTDGIIDIAGGEPTIYRHFDKILNLFIENKFERIDIHTNAIRYSKAIKKGIDLGVVNILVSIDAGTKETHRLVKGVSSFKKVWENIEKYVKDLEEPELFVRTKYIIVPGLNDTEKEIENWLLKSKSLGLKNVALNLDFNWLNRYSNHLPKSLYKLVSYTLKRASELEIRCDLYAQIREAFNNAYLSCHFLEHGLVFDQNNNVRSCGRYNPLGGGRPLLLKDYQGEVIDWENIFEQKNSHRDVQKSGGMYGTCWGCELLEFKNWEDKNYIDYLHINQYIDCNASCSYCIAVNDDVLKLNNKPYNIFPAIKDMVEKNILAKDAKIEFGGGEPTIIPEFEELLNFLLDNGYFNIEVGSSGIKYSSAIERGVKENKVKVIVPVDAGCSELYEKIKNVDEFSNVWKNIKRYSNAQTGDIKDFVIVKYLVIPGVNDIDSEVDKFIDTCKDSNVKNISFDIENDWYQKHKNADNSDLARFLMKFQKKIEAASIKHILYPQAAWLMSRNINYD